MAVYLTLRKKENPSGKDSMVTNKDLKNLIVPLFLEQLLVMLVGIADTFIVSYAGEAAVSGVSLVNSFSTIFIYLFTALAVYNAGVAWPTLTARVFLAAVITVLCFGRRNQVQYTWGQIRKWNQELMKRILRIAVPNGIENGIFQLVKVALSSVVALFGTYQIAANGIAQSIWSLAALAGVTMGPVFITVISQCMGAGDIKFTMVASIASTIGGRLAFSVLLAAGLNWGVPGIAAAMCLDWVIRAVIFALRLKSGKWKEFKVI